MRVYEFNRTTNAFNYVFEKSIAGNTTVLLKMPVVSPNKRGINDIGFACEDGIRLYATLSAYPKSETAIWQQIMPYDEINKTVSYIKIENTSDSEKLVNIKALFN